MKRISKLIFVSGIISLQPFLIFYILDGGKMIYFYRAISICFLYLVLVSLLGYFLSKIGSSKMDLLGVFCKVSFLVAWLVSSLEFYALYLSIHDPDIIGPAMANIAAMLLALIIWAHSVGLYLILRKKPGDLI